MTKLDLYKLPSFQGIFDDPRFQAILLHLKTELPGNGDESGDWFRGVHSTIQRIEGLKKPPLVDTPPSERAPKQLYADPRIHNQTAAPKTA